MYIHIYFDMCVCVCVCVCVFVCVCVCVCVFVCVYEQTQTHTHPLFTHMQCNILMKMLLCFSCSGLIQLDKLDKSYHFKSYH